MNYFQEFYDAAVEGDEKRIQELLEKGAIIGEYKQGDTRINAAFQLAKDGKDQAVELLRKYGASVHDIAKGYAVAGNHNKVEEYRRHHGASVVSIINGYAAGLYHEKVTEYYEKYKETSFYNDDNYSGGCLLPSAIAAGYVVANCTEKVKEYRNGFKPASIFTTAQTYAELGNTQAEAYLNGKIITLLNQDAQAKLINIIAIGYAIGGHIQELTRFYHQHHNDINNRYLCNAAAVNGDRSVLDAVFNLIQVQGTVPNEWLASGYGRSGHESKEEVMERVQGLAMGGHFSEMEKYRVLAYKNSLFPPWDTYTYIAQGISIKYIDSSASFLHFLSHCNVDCDLENFAKVLNSENGSYLSDKALKQVVKKAKSLGHYMKAGMDYEEANALYDHAHEIMNFLYNSTLQDKLTKDIFYNHILSQVTGLEPKRVTAFIEKVKALKWHIPLSEHLNGHSAEELLEKFLNKLAYEINKYSSYAKRRRIYGQSLMRKASIDKLDIDLTHLTHQNKPSLEILTSGIGLVKGHINATLADHKAKSRFSFFTTPDLVKAYREALSVLPSKLVERISAEKVILKVEETSQLDVAKSPSVMP